MKYKGTYYEMWDAWFMNVNGTIHGFHLKSHSGEDWNLGHVYTNDLLHFKKMRDVLETLPEEKYPDDCLGKFTGCAVEKDGKYYLFYTMRDKYRSQKIGLATSSDLEHFVEYENNPVFALDENLFVVRKKGDTTNCRDMNIVYDDKSGIYYGYFAAMANINGRGEIGVIGVAESSDLLNWSNQKIVYIPYFNGVIEVPSVFKIDGKWYMTMLTGTMYGAKAATDEPDMTCVTISACAERPTDLFEDCGIFLSGNLQSGYACRCIDYKEKIYAIYIDRSEYGAAISLPKEIKIIDGEPKPCYSDILKELRTTEKTEKFTFKKIPTAWPWDYVSAGKISVSKDVISVNADNNSFQGFMMENIELKSLEAEFNLSGNFREAGFVLLCHSGNENVWGRCAENEYYISVNRAANELVLYGNMLSPIYRRKLDFEKSEKLHMRVIAMEGQLEVYVNDVLVIQQGIKTEKAITSGIFSSCGNADFERLRLYEIE